MAERRSRWDKAWRKEDFPEIFFPTGLPKDPSIAQVERVAPDPEAGFYVTALYGARLMDAPGPGVKPSDEVEALRAELLVRLRRQPKDVTLLTRSAEGVSRMMGAKHRKSPKQQMEMVEKFLAVFNSMTDEAVFGEPQPADETFPGDRVLPAER